MSKLFIFEKSFTLLEILLVIGIIPILLVFIVPISLDFYKNQQLETQTQLVIQALRRAQSKAMSTELDSSFGLYINNQSYVLFKGNSYSGQYEEIFNFPDIISASGISEVVFSKFEGKPNVVGDIVLATDSNVVIININTIGRINW